MKKPTHHILVCGSYRQGAKQGVCQKKESAGLLAFLQEEAGDRGLDGVMVSGTACLNLCDEGPIVVVYPQNTWYKKVDVRAAEAILDSIENNTIASDYVLA